MIKVLVVAGTADAVEFINKAPANWHITATTISQLGADSIKKRDNLAIKIGPLDSMGFKNLLDDFKPNCVVDMSHPFSTEVTHNIKEATAKDGVPYFRYERASVALAGNIITYQDFPSAAKGLEKIKGNLLFTIGSRNLHYFQDLTGFYQRCYVRVLADSKILKQLEAMNIEPGHIFAMKGVASKELNIALAKEINAQAIITKDSGIKGGIQEKAAAAEALGIPLIVIDKPEKEKEVYSNIDELFRSIERMS